MSEKLANIKYGSVFGRAQMEEIEEGDKNIDYDLYMAQPS